MNGRTGAVSGKTKGGALVPMTNEQVLFQLLRYEICNTPLPEERLAFDPVALYRLSKHHDLAHLVADALSKHSLLPEDEKVRSAFERAQMTAVYREIQLTAATQRIRDAFREGRIPFVPLKGAIVRSFYPEPWMRTSCDVDVLIRENDLEKATQILTDIGFTTDGKQDFHDVSFYDGDVHLELHFNIRENIEQIDGLLSDVWDYTECFQDMEYRETPAFFLFHHVAHMSYHFVAGGCGIKPFLDLWLLRKNGFCEEDKIFPLLNACGLIPFYRAIGDLTDVWLEGKEHSDLTRQMEAYVLSGGVYGTSENGNATGAARKKGKFRYLWSLAFPSYRSMCVIYPSLRKKKVLLPFYYIRRFFAKLFGRDRKRVRSRWKATMGQDPGRIRSVEALLQAVGLNE